MKEESIEDVMDTNFIDEMTHFNEVTAPKIMKLLEEEDYLVATGTMGLISIARAIILNYGNDILMEHAVNALSRQDVQNLSEEKAESNN